MASKRRSKTWTSIYKPSSLRTVDTLNEQLNKIICTLLTVHPLDDSSVILCNLKSFDLVSLTQTITLDSKKRHHPNIKNPFAHRHVRYPCTWEGSPAPQGNQAGRACRPIEIHWYEKVMKRQHTQQTRCAWWLNFRTTCYIRDSILKLFCIPKITHWKTRSSCAK